MSDLVSIAEVWRDRARVAEQAASDLDGLVSAASATIRHNYFGHGCSEGAALFTALSDLIAGWCDETNQLSASLLATAARCRHAAQAIGDTDESAGAGMGE